MNTYGILNRQATVPLNPVDIGRQPQQGETDPSISNRQARVSQVAILGSTKNAKALSERQITASNVISKEGMQTFLGKASRYANVKDSMMRAAFKLTNPSRTPDLEFGSLHKSAIRLADHYQKLSTGGGSADEKLNTLRCLRATLEGMQSKQIGGNVLRGMDLSEAQKGPVQDMLRFVEHEISTQPQVHLNKAYAKLDDFKKLVSEGKGLEGEIQHIATEQKQKLLDQIEDHLLTAREGGATGSKDIQVLELVQNEKSRLKEHSSLESELVRAVRSIEKNRGKRNPEDFVPLKDKDGNLQRLKHVQTRQVDHVAEMSEQRKADNELAKQKRLDLAFERRELNSWAEIEQLGINMEVENFDRGRLNSVSGQMQIKDGLEWAKKDYLEALEQDSTPTIGPEIPEILPFDVDRGMPIMRIDSSLANDIGDKMGRGENAEELAEELGKDIAAELRKLDHDTQLAYAISDGLTLKSELLSMLAHECPNLNVEGIRYTGQENFEFSYEKASPEMKNFLDQVFTEAVSHLNDREIDINTLRINGQNYERKEILGEGSFGKVFRYENPRDGHSIAVKEPRIDGSSEELIANLRSEVAMHYQASGMGHPNVVELATAIPTKDGNILIAMELAPRGDVYDACKKIKEALVNGDISPQAANVIRLTLLKDMMKGMQHMQEGRGMIHLDVKPLNYFVGENGVAKLGDFGTSNSTPTVRLKDTSVDNPRWLAPEVLKGQGDRNTTVSQLKKQLEAKSQELIKQEWPKILSDLQQRNATEGDMVAAHKKLCAVHEKNMEKILQAQTFELSGKVDTWSLGITAYEMFVKENPFFTSDVQFSYQLADKIESFGEGRTNRLLKVGEDTPGMTALDRLLNRMIVPNPEDRISITEALTSSVFLEAGVDTENARELIKALTDKNPDPEKIRQLSKDLGI